MNPWLIVIGIVAFIGLIESTHRSNNKSSSMPSSQDLQAEDERLYAYLQKYPTASPTSQPGEIPAVTASQSNVPMVTQAGSGGTTPILPSPTNNLAMGSAYSNAIPVYSTNVNPYSYGGAPAFDVNAPGYSTNVNSYGSTTPENTGGVPTTNTPSSTTASVASGG